MRRSLPWRHSTEAEQFAEVKVPPAVIEIGEDPACRPLIGECPLGCGHAHVEHPHLQHDARIVVSRSRVVLLSRPERVLTGTRPGHGVSSPPCHFLPGPVIETRGSEATGRSGALTFEPVSPEPRASGVDMPLAQDGAERSSG